MEECIWAYLSRNSKFDEEKSRLLCSEKLFHTSCRRTPASRVMLMCLWVSLIHNKISKTVRKTSGGWLVNHFVESEDAYFGCKCKLIASGFSRAFFQLQRDFWWEDEVVKCGWLHADGSVVPKLHVFYLWSLPSITLKFKRSPLPISRFPPEMAEHTCRIHPPRTVELDEGGQLASHQLF